MPRPIHFPCVSSLLVASLLLACGCKSKTPEYAKPLPPGVSALRKLDPADWPDLSAALPMDDAFLAATKRSLSWFAKPSSQRFYPFDGITHDQARASVYALPAIAFESASTEAFLARLRDEFDVYTSIGWDGSGTVLFTGYYSPIFPASKVRTAEFRFPLYKRPADLAADPVTGEIKGRQVGNAITPYPTRKDIEERNLLAGTELVWLRSRLDAYIVEVQGSAQFRLTDGTTMLVGFAGSNGRDYTSIGRLLGEEGKLDRNKITLSAIRDHFKANPQELDGYIRRNDRFVFFTTYDQSDWPAGSLGVKVEPGRSLATDKAIYPRGCVTLVTTQSPQSPTAAPGETKSFNRLLLDQDTGGAIRAPGRADIYFGIGHEAELTAGKQVAEGRLYYVLLKPQRVAAWVQRMDR
ncbi:MAG: MltA domain-containing protein [Phycisphaeraceae bacterium]